MQSVFDNLLNGNLTDAKKGAKRFSQSNLAAYAVDEMGWGERRARLAVSYLKTGNDWQAYCDEEANERDAMRR